MSNEQLIIAKVFESIYFNKPLSEDVVHFLVQLKKKIKELLKESTNELTDADMPVYLKYLAVFEQYFKYLRSHDLDILDVPGLKQLMDDSNLTDEHLDGVAENLPYLNGFINFKRVIEHRVKQFEDFLSKKSNDGFDVLSNTIDFVIREFERYSSNHKRTDVGSDDGKKTIYI